LPFDKKFATNNPNLKQFIELHASLIACGQAEIFFRIPAEDMTPVVKPLSVRVLHFPPIPA
jgi:hypothetical protein